MLRQPWELSYDHSVLVYMKIEALEEWVSIHLMIIHSMVKIERSYIQHVYCNTWQCFHS